MSIVGSSVLEVTALSQPLHDLLGGEWADVDKEVLNFFAKGTQKVETTVLFKTGHFSK